MGEENKKGAENKPKEVAKEEVAKDKKPKTAKAKGKAAMPAENAGLLAKFRPKRRVIFFVVFLTYCAWMFLFYDPCGGKNKKKPTDCGFSGITQFQCITAGCLLSGGGERPKKTMKIKKEKGMKFGLHLDTEKETGLISVKSVSPGAVQAYNDALPAGSEDRILVGDFVSKFDTSTGKRVAKALSGAGAGTFVFEVQRPQLPEFLKFMASPTPGQIEKVLTSPGSKKWLSTFTSIAPMSVVAWFTSGYPLGSLPVYYLGLTGMVAYHTTRCCFDEKVAAGAPQCYRGGAELNVAHEKAYNASTKFATNTWKQARKSLEKFMASPKDAWKNF